jgi:hypothetical protein
MMLERIGTTASHEEGFRGGPGSEGGTHCEMRIGTPC